MSSEVDHLTAHIENAAEMEDMVFNKIINTPGIQAEIAATRDEPKHVDFPSADIGLLKQLSNDAGALVDDNDDDDQDDKSDDDNDIGLDDDNDELQIMFKEAMAQPSDPTGNKKNNNNNNDDDDESEEDLRDKEDQYKDTDKEEEQEIVYRDEPEKKDKADDDDNAEKAGLLGIYLLSICFAVTSI